MVVTILLLLVVCVLLYSTYNLLNKYEALEAEYDILYAEYEMAETQLSNMAGHIDAAISRMKEIDRIGSFEADDETGFVFKEMYQIVEDLEVYYGETSGETEK
jgi:hypothetical protein